MADLIAQTLIQLEGNLLAGPVSEIDSSIFSNGQFLAIPGPPMGASEAQAALVAANAAQAAQAAVEGALATVVSLVPDPDNPGLYLIASGLTADPDNDGLYLIGAPT